MPTIPRFTFRGKARGVLHECDGDWWSSTASLVNASGEDHVRVGNSRGEFHMLFHSFAATGGHAFARALAGPWTLGDVAAYNKTIA